MRNIKNFILVIGVIGIVVALCNTDTALAIDGVAQTENFIRNIIKTLVGIAGIIAVVFMVIAGFHYITSSGHPEKLDKAKSTLLYSGIGLVVVLAAYAIVDFVESTAKSSFGG
jgi:type IV secretory pathway VirB2 component (pilin)